VTSADDIADLRARERATRASQHCRIAVCSAAGCQSTGSAALRDQLARAVDAAGLDSTVRVMGTGCLGMCHEGPLTRVDLPHREPVLYGGADEALAQAIVLGAASGDLPEPHRCDLQQHFFTRQQRIVTANAGHVDPERIDDYLAMGGYEALERALTDLDPSDVVKTVTASGLRGRGGAGYPTGLKWSTVAKAAGPHKFVVCNADEGDPGAFMDRSVLEGDPHRVLEGMAIAGYAVGADRGYIYARGEYPLAVNRLKTAIRQAERLQILGNRILDTPFNFRIDIRIGAGAFVCGEETALIASIEGKRGTPRPRPPFPAESGLWGRPTLINNVETFASIAPIVLGGGEAYSRIGTAHSKGTKVFALAGRVVHTGLVEVPMGMTLRDIVFDIGGGIPGGRRFKAAQTGGPSGGCIPTEHLDLPVDYEALASIGSIMGSGGLVVMDETSCMVDVARYFMEFCRDESCGKCVPCRAGTVQMHELLVKMTQGLATERDLQLLEQLTDTVSRTSLCGLGQAASNPVKSTLRYFRDEYLAHILERRCPAGSCRMTQEAVR
jgi:bidirectional [NiFe] hydrogenase diaphorase subunit